MTVSEALSCCLKKGIPFYAYRLPGEEEVCFGAQPEGRVEELKEVPRAEGFILVPFQEKQETPALWIRGEVRFRESTDDEEKLRRLTEAAGMPEEERIPEESVSREEYHRQVCAMIADLQKGVVRKLVLSRGRTVRTEGWERLPGWFGLLVKKYPDAFVFVVSVPGVTTWMGATPEVFLEQTAEGARTMALAGTRPAGSPGVWGRKEKEEQAIVTEYIAGLLGREKGWKQKGPFTKRAGGVEHLCTTFSSSCKLEGGEVERLRHLLHPTPAVGGFPAREAIRIVCSTEGRDRRYYAGYLGPVHRDGCFHWYVNLRSMEVFPEAVHLYVGGGITALSDPQKEWEETELKSGTMLDVIGEIG